MTRTFAPAYGKGKVLVTSVTTSRTEIDAKNGNSNAVAVSNLHLTDDMYVRAGDSSVVATADDYLVLARTTQTITKATFHTHIAAIAISNTPSLHAIPGNGF